LRKEFKAVDVTAANTELNQNEKQNIEKFKKDLYPSMLETKIESKVILPKTFDFANGWGQWYACTSCQRVW
jgi:hypothetical protein